MSEVKKFAYYPEGIIESEHGNFVRYSDYEKLRAENDELTSGDWVKAMDHESVKHDLQVAMSLLREKDNRLTKLTKQNKIMKKALKFYVEKMILEPNGVVDWDIVEREGETASEALKKCKDVDRFMKLKPVDTSSTD